MSDYIDRQAAIDALKGLPTWWADGGGYYGGAQPPMVALLDPEDAVSAIENLPSAEVEPVKKGKWIYDNQFHWYRASCSECGYKRVTDIKAEKWNGWKYCPNCGAKMEAAPTIIEAEEI